MARLSGRRLALLAGAALVTLPAVGRAQGADEGAAQRMNSIEGQIRALQEQLRTMRHDLTVRDSQLRAAQRDAARAREEAERIQPAPVAVPQQPPPGPGLAGVLASPGSTLPLLARESSLPLGRSPTRRALASRTRPSSPGRTPRAPSRSAR